MGRRDCLGDLEGSQAESIGQAIEIIQLKHDARGCQIGLPACAALCELGQRERDSYHSYRAMPGGHPGFGPGQDGNARIFGQSVQQALIRNSPLLAEQCLQAIEIQDRILQPGFTEKQLELPIEIRIGNEGAGQVHGQQGHAGLAR